MLDFRNGKENERDERPRKNLIIINHSEVIFCKRKDFYLYIIPAPKICIV